jgi:hypothetical protein
LFVIWCPNRTLGPLPCSADPLSPRRRPRRPSDVGAKPYVFADHLAAMLLGDQLIGYHRRHADPYLTSIGVSGDHRAAIRDRLI